MSIKQEIEASTTKGQLQKIAKRLQLRKIPAGITVEALKQVLLNTVGDREAHTEKVCECGDLKRSHRINNETGEVFECKRPSCGCTKFVEKA